VEDRNCNSKFPDGIGFKESSSVHRLQESGKITYHQYETGITIAQIEIDSDTDDVFYDSSSNQIYVSCGGGYIDVFKQMGPDKYEAISRIESRSGARTSLFVPELNQLMVAAPARSGSAAQLMIYGKK
jgi:hypothetical protein